MFIVYLTLASTRFVMTVNPGAFFANAKVSTGGSMIPQNTGAGEYPTPFIPAALPCGLFRCGVGGLAMAQLTNVQ